MHVRDLSALGPEADFQGVTFDPQPAADHGLEPPACHDVVVAVSYTHLTLPTSDLV